MVSCCFALEPEGLLNRERTETSLGATGRSRATDALRRGAFFALAVVLGFLLLELPWNDGVFAIPQRYVVDNLLILGLGCAIVFLAGQRTRASLAVFTGFCLLWGTANFFIITFKGQPIVPADLFALGTAASVAGGYSLFLTGRLVFCWALFAAYCVALAKLCPQRKRARWDVAANVLAAALLVCLGTMQYQAIDIKSDCDVTVDVWDVRGSYATQGTALCFLSRAQELTPKPPEGYSAEAVDAILAPFAEDPLTGTDGTVAESPSPDTTGNQNSAAPTTGDAAPEPARSTPLRRIQRHRHHERDVLGPLATTPALRAPTPRPDALSTRLPTDALEPRATRTCRRWAAGTCNSEFEFLTGVDHGQPRRRRVPLRAVRPRRRARASRRTSDASGVRAPTRSTRPRRHELAPRPRVRAAGLRRVRRHQPPFEDADTLPRACHRPRHLRAACWS